jgi:hypothetical protein
MQGRKHSPIVPYANMYVCLEFCRHSTLNVFPYVPLLSLLFDFLQIYIHMYLHTYFVGVTVQA